MNDFIPANTKNRGSQDVLCLGIDNHFHEALRLALLPRAAHAGHRIFRQQRLAPRLAHLRLGHAHATQRRIDVKVVGRNAIAEPARIVIQQIGRDDFEVVVRGMREAAVAIAVAQRPDARNVRPELLVDVDVAVLVLLDASFVEAEVIGVRTAADRQQYVRSLGRLRVPRAIDAGQNLVSALFEADAGGVGTNGDSFVFNDAADRDRKYLRPLSAPDVNLFAGW